MKAVTAGARNEITLHTDARRVSSVPGNLNVDLFEQQRRQCLIGPAAVAHHVSDFQSIDHLNFVSRGATVRTELRLHRRPRRAANIHDSGAASDRDSDHHRGELIHRAAGRNVLDDVLCDRTRHRRALHVDEGRFGCDLDRFRHSTHFHVCVHLCGEVREHFNAFTPGCAEPGQRKCHAI